MLVFVKKSEPISKNVLVSNFADEQSDYQTNFTRRTKTSTIFFIFYISDCVIEVSLSFPAPEKREAICALLYAED